MTPHCLPGATLVLSGLATGDSCVPAATKPRLLANELSRGHSSAQMPAPMVWKLATASHPEQPPPECDVQGRLPPRRET